MSDANLIDLFYKENGGAYGTIPGGNGKTLRLTGETLAATRQFVKSREIRSDRQSSDVVLIGIGAGGTIDGELSYGAFDDLFKAVLLSAAWAGAASVTGTNISAAAADNSINSASSAFGSITAGQWIRVTGFTTNGTAFWARVTTATSAKLVLAGPTLVNESAGASVTVKASDKIQVGTTIPDFVFERKHSDVASVFSDFVGCAFDTFELRMSAQGIITVQFGVIGKDETKNTSTQMGTPTAATTNDVMNGVRDPLKLYEGGISVASEMSAMELTLRVANKIRTRLNLGSLGPVSLGAGDVDVTGTLRAYFVDATKKDKFLAATKTSFAFVVRDPSNNTYVFELPAAKFKGESSNATGVGTDIIEPLEFEAYRDATVGNTLLIHRIVA